VSDQVPNVPWVDSGGPAPPPPPADVQAPRAASPLETINRRVNWALGVAIFSIFCGGIVFGIISLVLAFSAQRMARSFGVTSSDGKIKAAKWIAIVATALWAIFIVVVIIAAAANNGNNNNSPGA
jgi:hypothetical protein